MNAISFAKARRELAKTMKQVCEDHVPVVITRPNAPPVVMMSLEDYQSVEETAYLLRSPANARRLAESIKQIESGHAVERQLVE